MKVAFSLRTVLVSATLLAVIQAQLLIPKIRPGRKIIPGIKTQTETTELPEKRQVTRPIPGYKKNIEETTEIPGKRRPQESTIDLEETTEQVNAAGVQESATPRRVKRAARRQETTESSVYIQEETTTASGQRRPQEMTAEPRNQEETTESIERFTDKGKRGNATGMRGRRNAKVPPPSTVAAGGRARRSAN